MGKFHLPNMGHIINALPPKDITGSAQTSKVWSMRDHLHCDIVIVTGATMAATSVLTVEQCDNFTPSTHPAIAFDVYKCETTTSDLLGAKVACTSAGFTIAATAAIMYVIPIESAQLTDGYPNLRVCLASPGAATTLVGIFAILSGARFSVDQSPTEIA